MAAPKKSPTPNVDDADLSTISAAEPDPGIGLVKDRVVNSEQAAAQRAAVQEHLRRANPGRYAPLPNGQFAEVRGSVYHRYPGAKKTILMADPKQVVHPDFRMADWGPSMPRYQWRCRTDTSTQRRDLETAMLHKQGKIRYVEVGEIDTSSPYAVIEEYAVPGGNNVYVIMDTMILCEILDPEHSYEKYAYWEDLALSFAENLPEQVMSFPETHVRSKTKTEVTRANTKTGG